MVLYFLTQEDFLFPNLFCFPHESNRQNLTISPRLLATIGDFRDDGIKGILDKIRMQAEGNEQAKKGSEGDEE